MASSFQERHAEVLARFILVTGNYCHELVQAQWTEPVWIFGLWASRNNCRILSHSLPEISNSEITCDKIKQILFSTVNFI